MRNAESAADAKKKGSLKKHPLSMYEVHELAINTVESQEG